MQIDYLVFGVFSISLLLLLFTICCRKSFQFKLALGAVSFIVFYVTLIIMAFVMRFSLDLVIWPYSGLIIMKILVLILPPLIIGLMIYLTKKWYWACWLILILIIVVLVINLQHVREERRQTYFEYEFKSDGNEKSSQLRDYQTEILYTDNQIVFEHGPLKHSFLIEP